jgi:sulfoxide reductase heme-binding subunit YedZ
MIITSLVRGRLNRILWRAIHLLAYLCWPVAFAHSIGSSKDLQHGWLLSLSIACALAVTAAIGWRLASAARQLPRAARVAAIFSQHSAQHSPRQHSPRQHSPRQHSPRQHSPRQRTVR